MQQLREENISLKENMQAMKTRLTHLGKSAIRSNVVVAGLGSTSVKSAINELINLSNSVLKTNVNVTKVRKLPNKSGFVSTMNTALEANAVVSSENKLRGSNVYMQKDSTADECTAMFHLRQLNRYLRSVDSRLKICNGKSCLYMNDMLYAWANDDILAPREDANFLRSLTAQTNHACNIIVAQKPDSANQGTSSSTHLQNFHSNGMSNH